MLAAEQSRTAQFALVRLGRARPCRSCLGEAGQPAGLREPAPARRLCQPVLAGLSSAINGLWHATDSCATDRDPPEHQNCQAFLRNEAVRQRVVSFIIAAGWPGGQAMSARDAERALRRPQAAGLGSVTRCARSLPHSQPGRACHGPSARSAPDSTRSPAPPWSAATTGRPVRSATRPALGPALKLRTDLSKMADGVDYRLWRYAES